MPSMTAVARRLPDVVGHHGASCAAYEWTPTTPPRGLVLIFHGLGAHGATAPLGPAALNREAGGC